LGVSYPFFIDEGSAAAMARTYALAFTISVAARTTFCPTPVSPTTFATQRQPAFHAIIRF